MNKTLVRNMNVLYSTLAGILAAIITFGVFFVFAARFPSSTTLNISSIAALFVCPIIGIATGIKSFKWIESDRNPR